MFVVVDFAKNGERSSHGDTAQSKVFSAGGQIIQLYS